MRSKLTLYLISMFILFNETLYAESTVIQEELLSNMKECRLVESVLERLACYDSIKIGEINDQKVAKNIQGMAWNRANEQEKSRQKNDTKFIVTQVGEANPIVLLTTPALGYPIERPILMLSCIDNITRLQVALTQPIEQSAVNVVLTTERASLSSQWFVRENYFLLEASRGLDGIKEIQQLFYADTLRIQAKHKEFTDLVFNIKGLENDIKPLRTACHW